MNFDRPRDQCVIRRWRHNGPLFGPYLGPWYKSFYEKEINLSDK